MFAAQFCGNGDSAFGINNAHFHKSPAPFLKLIFGSGGGRMGAVDDGNHQNGIFS